MDFAKLLPSDHVVAASLECADGSFLAAVVREGTTESVVLVVKREAGRFYLALVVPVAAGLSFNVDGSGVVPVIEIGDHMVRCASWDGVGRMGDVVAQLIATAPPGDGGAAWLDIYKPKTYLAEDLSIPSYSNVMVHGRYSSPEQRSDMKKLYIHTQLRLREAEFTEHHNVVVFVGTWNVNGKPPADSLTDWLLVEGQTPDLVVCGFQELDQSVSVQALNTETAKADPWISAIAAALGRLGTYVNRSKQQLGGVLQLVWVRKALLPHVRDVQEQSKRSGFAFMANKGGIAVRLDIFDSSFCFVCAHLNAHDENVERRNQDFAAIAADVKFSANRTIWDHQFLFWYGDLNYRIALPRPRIFELIAGAKWAQLLAHDQLTEQRRLGAAFSEFTEGPIEWAPTYRFDVGTHTYDTSEKQRRPSYTDRVLHKAATPASLTQLHYQSVGSLSSSDHKPVYAVYLVRARALREQDYRRVYASVVRELDKVENALLPTASLSCNALEFGDVRYGTPVQRRATLHNTGSVLVAWRLIAKPNQAPQLCKPWAHIEPVAGELMPGEQCAITVTVLVEGSDVAGALALGLERLEDVLVVHLDQGKDYFVTLAGHYLRSCFGCALDHLVRIAQPIRSAANLLKPEQSLRVPKELWALVDHLYRFGLNEPDLFLQSGVAEEMGAIRECLDTGAPLDSAWSPHSFADTLLQFLRALPHPVIPINYYAQAVDPASSHAFCQQLVESLPDVHLHVFHYLISFGREMLTPAKYRHNVAALELAQALGNVLLRPPRDARYAKPAVVEKQFAAKAEFVYRFLTDKDDD